MTSEEGRRILSVGIDVRHVTVITRGFDVTCTLNYCGCVKDDTTVFHTEGKLM